MDIPPFCPHPSCFLHHLKTPRTGWFENRGHYFTKAFGCVPRFRCLLCGKSFSTQTFSIDYYAKKIVSYQDMMSEIVSNSGIRQIARRYGYSTGTVGNRIQRLARQALWMHAQLLKEHVLKEDLTADGFESFAVSQYFPDNFNILVGKQSQLVYFADYVTIRRKGRMTKQQKMRRKALEKQFRADPKGILNSFSQLSRYLLRLGQYCGNKILLFTDRNRNYRQALQENRDIGQLKKQGLFQHITISSRKARTLQKPLFPVNYMDREFRKDLANHVRETVRFTRNVNDGIARLAVYLAHHNYSKRYRILQPVDDNTTHGEMAGITKEAIDTCWSTLFTNRAFLSLGTLWDTLVRMWFRDYPNPLKKRPEYVQGYCWT